MLYLRADDTYINSKKKKKSFKYKINKTVYLINAFNCKQLKFISSDTIFFLRIFRF